MKKRLYIIAVGCMVCILAFFLSAVLSKKETAKAETSFVNYSKQGLKFVGHEEELDCYSDNDGILYYYQNEKLRMIMLPDIASDKINVTKDYIIETSRNWIEEKLYSKIPYDMEEEVIFMENIGYDYKLSQKIGDSKITLVTLTYSENGNLLSGNFMDDNYMTEEKKKEVLSYSDEMAIKTAKEYVESNKKTMLPACDFIFDDDVNIKTELTCCMGKIYKIVSFTAERDIMYGLFVYIDANEKTVDFTDMLK